MATIKCKGLTGVMFDLTVTMGSTTMNGLTALAKAVEGQEITTSMYAEIIAEKDKTINQTDHGGDNLTAAGLVEGDITIQTCWDSDRLELGRVGIKPLPERLCTEFAKRKDIIEEAYRRSINN